MFIVVMAKSLSGFFEIFATASLSLHLSGAPTGLIQGRTPFDIND